jgi:hypothetical protein
MKRLFALLSTLILVCIKPGSGWTGTGATVRRKPRKQFAAIRKPDMATKSVD